MSAAVSGRISGYLKEIGRGKEGARDLDRAQAADLMAAVLDGVATDLEVGAFCIAMRIKGETAHEMAGFIDAAQSRMERLPAGPAPLVVLPSYNGARKLPLLTPLLGLLLSRQGLPVLIHGHASESTRTTVDEVLRELGILPLKQIRSVVPGELAFAPTSMLCPQLARLLDVRRTIGLRNSVHSLVKQMNPSAGPAVLVSSYTHPEYSTSMAQVIEQLGSTALLLRGTEGEPVADPRRLPSMRVFHRGVLDLAIEPQTGSLASMPDLPRTIDAEATAHYTRAVLTGIFMTRPWRGSSACDATR